MSQLVHLIQSYGVLIVFGLVLVEQIGLPIPAFPILVVAGALAVDGRVDWALALGAVVAACLAADYFWFRAGRSHGKRILRLLCRISLAPDSCVSQTEDRFRRYGPKSLLVSKFVPGFNTVAAPLSGAIGTRTPHFLAFSVSGATLWGGSGILLGATFSESVEQVLGALETMGSTALAALFALLALFLVLKFNERRRLMAEMAVPRIDMAELRALIDGGQEPVIIDARSLTARELEASIPGALAYHASEPQRLMATLDKDRHIVIYCSCPNDVTAAHVAKQFMASGFHRARPLKGGLDAWNAQAGDAPPPRPAAC